MIGCIPRKQWVLSKKRPARWEYSNGWNVEILRGDILLDEETDEPCLLARIGQCRWGSLLLMFTLFQSALIPLVVVLVVVMWQPALQPWRSISYRHNLPRLFWRYRVSDGTAIPPVLRQYGNYILKNTGCSRALLPIGVPKAFYHVCKSRTSCRIQPPRKTCP